MNDPFVPTSVVHRNIGEHEHEVDIYTIYQFYAVGRKCGLHSYYGGDDEGPSEVIDFFKKKFPKNPHIVDENY